MLIRSGKYKYQVYAMDYETHSDSELLKEFEKNPSKAKTSIWLWYLINDKDNYKSNCYGYDMESFFNKLSLISMKKKKEVSRCMIFDYNLAFEFSFMLPYLEKHHFTYKEVIDEKVDTYCYNLICNSSLSNVWEIRIKLDIDNSLIIIRDLAKILGGGSLRKLAESYKLETQKGDIDYKLNRRCWYDEYDLPHYYNIDNEPSKVRYEPTDEELMYCFKDVRIIIDLLSNENIQKDKEFWTSVSSASYSFKKGINFGYKNYFKPKKAYRRDYPELDLEETEFVRNSVGGGICYCVPRYQYRIIEKGKIYNNKECNGILHIDMHNAHPSQMYKKDFPYKKGKYFSFGEKAILNKDKFKGYLFYGCITCVRCYISYTNVKLHSIIKLIGIDATSGVEITCWDFELLTMYEAYENLKVELLDCYIYRKRKFPFNEYFKFNYDERKKAKASGDTYNINQKKLLNNSFYGKLLEHGHNEVFIPYIADDGINTTQKKLIDITSDDYNINGTYTYVPAGSCVPAYTRCWLVRTALGLDLKGYTPPKDFYKNIIYFDTDSIFMLDNEDTREFMKHLDLEDDLYNWGVEEHIEKAQFACPKRYKLKLDDIKRKKDNEIKVAGFQINTSFEATDIIRSELFVNRGYRIQGGTIISRQLKVLDVDNKYRMIYENNINT